MRHTLNRNSHGVYSGLYCPTCGEKCQGYSGAFNPHCLLCGGEMLALPNPDNWANIKDQYLFQPIVGGDGRVLVQEDPFKSKYECSTCHGKGHTDIICKWCLGTKWEKGKEENGYCRDCTIGEAGGGKTLGHEPCETCKGTGGLIVTPEESQKNTTTGNILAISDVGITKVKVNDKIMFTNYTGSPFKFMDIDLRIIVEKDILGIVKQLKQNVDGLSEGTFADLENTGTPHI